jgi:hypothetical protein
MYSLLVQQAKQKHQREKLARKESTVHNAHPLHHITNMGLILGIEGLKLRNLKER